jgi:hypothetical protein
MLSIVNEKWMKSIHGDINNDVGDGDVINVCVHDMSSSNEEFFPQGGFGLAWILTMEFFHLFHGIL